MSCKCCNQVMSSNRICVAEHGDDKCNKVVEIHVQFDGNLCEETKYCLIVAQPCPVEGYNLPVVIVIEFDEQCCIVEEDEKGKQRRCIEKHKAEKRFPIKKLYSHGGVCNLEFGEDLPKCRNRLPLYYTNGKDFIDIRGAERASLYCK